MPQYSGAWTNFIEGHAKRVKDGLKRRKTDALYPKYVSVRSTDKQTEREIDIENGGPIFNSPEGAVYQEYSFGEGYSKAFTQAKWAAEISFTKEMRKFDRFDLATRMSNEMMDGAYLVKEIIGTDYLEYGDATSGIPQAGGRDMINNVTGNGARIFASSQAYNTSAVTYSTKSGANADITEDSLNDYWTIVRRWKNSAGVPLIYGLRGIIYPPDLSKQAYKTMESRLEALTANNAIQTALKYFKGEPIMIENQFLSSTTAWYIMTDADEEHGIKFYFAWDDDVSEGYEDPKTKNYCTSVDFSFAHGCNRNYKLYKVAA